MKTIFRITVLLFILAVISCKKDSKCTIVPPIEENIVGTWNAYFSFMGQSQSGDVIFNSDHTGTSPGEVFQNYDSNGNLVQDFTWSIQNGTELKIDHGSPFKTIYDILDNQCDVIKLDFGGIEGKLTRK
jgi:hypothetical protein